MVRYKIQVRNSAGDILGEFDKFRKLKFGKALNNYGACSFEVPVKGDKAESLIALRIYSVWIYRDSDLVWAGEQATREANLDDKGDNWVTIYCFDWLEQLNARYTALEVIYTGIDAGQIAWDLIDDSQNKTNGDFGITEGAIEATMVRDRTYNNDNIMDSLINLANVINGFDFEITSGKVFNVYAHMGVDRSASIVLEYGINIRTAHITEDFVNPVNGAIILGDSGVLAEPVRVERNDAASQAQYGLREGLLNEMTTIETETLEEKGDALILKYGLPLFRVGLGIVRSITPTITDFSLGDLIRLKVKEGIYDIDRSFRVYGWGVKYDSDNTETLDLVLGDFDVSEIS